MTEIEIQERGMSESELARMNEGFNEHTTQSGNPIEIEERFGFVATNSGKFIGCSSGLAYKHDHGYNNWFFLSDLFVEAPYRGDGLGVQLLERLEQRVAALGMRYIYTWTAGFEAPEFYKKQGYTVFSEFEQWYQAGHSRVGLKKSL